MKERTYNLLKFINVRCIPEEYISPKTEHGLALNADDTGLRQDCTNCRED